MSEHIFASISAVGMNGEIGKNNDLVYRNREDLQRFKSLTMGKAVIMGTKTFESIGSKGLPGRKNIVITRKYVSDIKYIIRDDVMIVEGLELATEFAKMYSRQNGLHETFFIGGASVYEEAFKYISKLYLTEIRKSFEGADTFFPSYDKSQWIETERLQNEEFDFVTYTKTPK